MRKSENSCMLDRAFTGMIPHTIIWEHTQLYDVTLLYNSIPPTWRRLQNEATVIPCIWGRRWLGNGAVLHSAEWQWHRKVIQKVQQHCLIWISLDTY